MSLALFDMDRTLVLRDTASLYVRYRRDIGEATMKDTLQVAWWLLQYTLGVIDAERVAEQALASYRGKAESWMEETCRDWFRRYVLEHVAGTGRTAVRRHQDAGHAVAIVTGATRYAAEPLAAELGIDHVVCTELEVAGDGTFTGKVKKPLCYGSGKIQRTRVLCERIGFDLREATFYSDSITDLPLLEAVARPIVVNPDPRLRRVAKSRGWPIETWR
jgi:HAD superfamily hydrolase (TIGR01490 family)